MNGLLDRPASRESGIIIEQVAYGTNHLVRYATWKSTDLLALRLASSGLPRPES